MGARESGTITHLLEAWNRGDDEAGREVIPLLYDEMYALAALYLRRQSGYHTLQATALVNEGYIRLIERNGLQWKNRGHFVGVMSKIMRHVLVDHARQRSAAKRGGQWERVNLEEAAELMGEQAPDLLELDEALSALEAIDPEKTRLVELRFFGGLSIEEAAEALGISSATANRRWRRARTWLFRQLKKSG